MRSNLAAKRPKVYTHEGGKAVANLKPIDQLRRSVLSCLLWEKEFYEDGQSIADRIKATAAICDPVDVAALAIEARQVHGLRHVPLLLTVSLIKLKYKDVAGTIANVCQRADEMAELVSLYWQENGGRKMIPRQMKKGLALAFNSFNEYALGKYKGDQSAVKLRDVMFLCHPKPWDDERAALQKRVADGTLAIPDTWEVELSGGKDKKETFERLIREGKLGYLALLRNLRNMDQAGVDLDLVRDAIVARKGAKWVFPFRYVAAARATPRLEPEIDTALRACIDDLPRLRGETIVLVDVSGSMDVALSAKSDMTRMDAACALGAVINGNVRMFSFSNKVVEVPPRRGMAGIDALRKSQEHSGTYLAKAIELINQNNRYDRLIVITDEQSHDGVTRPAPGSKAYLINVASYKNGVGYGQNGFVHIDGFSEAVIKYIAALEADTERA